MKKVDLILFNKYVQQLKELEARIFIFFEKYVREKKIRPNDTFVDFERNGDVFFLKFNTPEDEEYCVGIDAANNMKICFEQEINCPDPNDFND